MNRVGTAGIVFFAFASLLGCSRQKTLDVTFDINPERKGESAAKQSQVREFLWKHWQRKSAAIAHIEARTSEGSQLYTTIELRPISGGSILMHVAAVEERQQPDGTVMYHVVKNSDAVKVERVQPCRAGEAIHVTSGSTVVPENMDARGSEYCLRLTGSAGEWVDVL